MPFGWINATHHFNIIKYSTNKVRYFLTPSAPSSRIVELDALRGMAALSVVFYHYTTRYDQIYGHTHSLPLSFSIGRYGVFLFFMISGFVILMSLEHTQRIQDFVIKRFVRLYPPYWLAIALTFFVVAVAGLPGREVSAQHAILNSLMIHPFFGIPDVDGVYWTLLVEFIFYVLMAGLFIARLTPYIEWVTVFWLGLNTLENHDILIEISDRLEPWLIVEHAHLFIMGIMFYRLRQHGGSIMRYSILAACFASQIALYPEIDKHLVVLGFMVAFFLINAGRLKAIAIPPLLFLGTISYPLYLIHQNIGYVVIRTLEQRGLSPILSIIAATSLAIALAVLITYFVEKPSLGWMKKISRQSSNPSSEIK